MAWAAEPAAEGDADLGVRDGGVERRRAEGGRWGRDAGERGSPRSRRFSRPSPHGMPPSAAHASAPSSMPWGPHLPPPGPNEARGGVDIRACHVGVLVKLCRCGCGSPTRLFGFLQEVEAVPPAPLRHLPAGVAPPPATTPKHAPRTRPKKGERERGRQREEEEGKEREDDIWVPHVCGSTIFFE